MVKVPKLLQEPSALSFSSQFILSEEDSEEEVRGDAPDSSSDSDREFKDLFSNVRLIRPTTSPPKSEGETEEEEHRDGTLRAFVEKVVTGQEDPPFTLLLEEDKRDKKSDWVLVDEGVSQGEPRIEVVLSEDNLEEPVDGLVPCKTWWETFFGMDEKKAAIYQALYEEKEAIAAEARLLQEQVSLKRGKGNGVLMQALTQATPEIQAKIIDIRRRAREVIRKAHKQAEILAELQQQRLAENIATSPQAAGGGWLSVLWGAEQEQPDQEEDEYKFYPPEDPVKYTPTQTKLYKERVEGCIGTTDIGQWDPHTAAWFMQEGANHEFVVTIPPISHPLEEVQTVALKKAQSFTPEEVKQIFALHAINCLTSGCFIGYWPQYLWDFLNLNPDACEVDTAEMSRLRKERGVYLTLSGYLLAGCPGYKWTEDEWRWFLSHQDKVYAWGTDAQISGDRRAELQESLQINRDLHRYVCSALEQGVLVSDWPDEAWEWFQEYGLYETLGGSLIDQGTFEALKSLRTSKEDGM